MAVGERIKKIRKYYKCSQRDFATSLNLSQAHISNIEANKDCPSEKILKQISATYNANIDWLKNGKGSMWMAGCCTEDTSKAQKQFPYKADLRTMPIFTRRLVFLFEESGATKNQLTDFIYKETGIQLVSSDVAGWCEGTNIDLDLIPVIADFFGVSIEFMFTDFKKIVKNKI